MVIFMPNAIQAIEMKAGIRFNPDKHTVDEWLVDKKFCIALIKNSKFKISN